MVTTTEQVPGNSSRRLLTDFAPVADSLSKAVAALAIALYVCGFLIVSLHHANYGFVGTNPFRPRILAAGAWFLLFTAIPVAVAKRYRERSWISIGASLAFVWYAFYTSGSILFYLAFDSLALPPPVLKPSWWYLASGAGLVLAFVFYLVAVKSKNSSPAALAAGSVVLVIFISGLQLQNILISRSLEPSGLAFWFLGVFMITVLELKTNPGDYSGDKLKGLGVDIGAVFGVIFVFAHFCYPHIKASWGGGSPVPVTIYVTKDSAIKPNQPIAAQLVEESDDGLYFISPKETKAIYIPRNAIALLYFSDNPSDSALLRENK